MIRIVEVAQVSKILARKAARFEEAELIVRPILEAVRMRGDKALIEYAQKFDKLERKSVRVPERELKAAEAQLSTEFRDAVKVSARNIRAYAKLQLPVAKSKKIAPGLRLGQVVRPLDSVAAYIPSGRYP